MKKFLSGVLALVLAMPLTMAQQKEVSGVVTSLSDGTPVVGATVHDKATGQFAITDEKGAYHLFVSDKSDVLSIMCLGFKDVEVTARNERVNVQMEPDVMSLDETMVIAYGVAKSSSFTGSASVVKKDALEKIPASNISTALQGMSSGVQVINNSGQPGDGGTIMIRGVGSVNASSSPLWVVDGVPFSGYINAIAPSDIESMTVLKDASATALYGSRAANGVIIVTTKKGTSDKGQINFRSSLSFSSLAVDLPRALTPQEFTETTWLALYNNQRLAGIDSTTAAQYATDNLTSELKVSPWSVDKPVGTDGRLVSDAQLLWNDDWRGETMKSRPRQEYTIDFSGKSGNTTYFFSAGFLDDKGVFTTQQFRRVTGRANVTAQVKPWLEIGTNTSFSHSKTDSPAGDSVVWFLRPRLVWMERPGGCRLQHLQDEDG